PTKSCWRCLSAFLIPRPLSNAVSFRWWQRESFGMGSICVSGTPIERMEMSPCFSSVCWREQWYLSSWVLGKALCGLSVRVMFIRVDELIVWVRHKLSVAGQTTLVVLQELSWHACQALLH